MVRVSSLLSIGVALAGGLSASLASANGLKFAVADAVTVSEVKGILTKVVAGSQTEAAGMAALRAGMGEAQIVGAGIVSTAEALSDAVLSGVSQESVMSFIDQNHGLTLDAMGKAIEEKFGKSDLSWAVDTASLGIAPETVVEAIKAQGIADYDRAYAVADSLKPAVAEQVREAMDSLDISICTTPICEVASENFKFALEAASLAPAQYTESAIKAAVLLTTQNVYADQRPAGLGLGADVLTFAGISDLKTKESVAGQEAVQSLINGASQLGENGQILPMPEGQRHCLVGGHEKV